MGTSLRFPCSGSATYARARRQIIFVPHAWLAAVPQFGFAEIPAVAAAFQSISRMFPTFTKRRAGFKDSIKKALFEEKNFS